MKGLFRYRWSLSRIWLILVLIAFFLTLVSYIKWIQILMFIPALVLALFFYSYLEVRKLKKFVVPTLMKQRSEYLIYFRTTKNIEFFFRVGCKIGDEVTLLKQRSSQAFSFPNDPRAEVVVYLKWSFDILRYVVNLWKINRKTSIAKLQIDSNDYNDNSFFLVRWFESWDSTKRLDSMRTAIKDSPYVRAMMNFENDNSWLRSDRSNLALKVASNQKLEIKDELYRSDFMKWLLIALNIIVIHIEWQDYMLSLSLLLIAIPTFYTVKIRSFRLTNLKFLNLLILLFFVAMIFFTVLRHDMTWPWSVFLTQILIVKSLFKDEREDWFLYIFLSMFVFVAVSLFSVELWFILFFLIYLILSVTLLRSVSWYMVTDPLEWAIESKTWPLKFLVAIFFAFALMFVLFFALPHWNRSESQDNIVSPRNPDSTSWFSNELNFKNASSIKTDNSKVIAVDINNKKLLDTLKTAYWRWERFYSFLDNSWSKYTDKKVYFTKKPNETKWYEELDITFLKKWNSSLFFPVRPVHFSLQNIENTNLAYENTIDNTIFYLRSKTSEPLSVSAFLRLWGDGMIIDDDIRFKKKDEKIFLSKETEKLFSRFWKVIDEKWLKDPAKITSFIKNRYWFEYSITDPSKSIEDFLYWTKKWYCEYYATVLALTLQHLWYHATVVNGYYAWEYSEMASSWIIRWKDAHSWVEVFEQGKWKVYDATPNVLDIANKPLYRRMADYMVAIYDYLDIRWYAYIVNYTWEAQKDLLLLLLWYKWDILLIFVVFVLFYGLYFFFPYFKSYFSVSYEDKLIQLIRKKVWSSFPIDNANFADEELKYRTREALYGKDSLTKHIFTELTRVWKDKINNQAK